MDSEEGRHREGRSPATDLAAYASSSKHDPLSDPSIDQNLLGQEYQIVMPYKVVKVEDGYTVRNKAIQVTNDLTRETNEVSNPLKEINPAKDVTVKVGGESIDGRSVYKDRTFLYQLDSSIIPAGRATRRSTSEDRGPAEHRVRPVHGPVGRVREP